MKYINNIKPNDSCIEDCVELERMNKLFDIVPDPCILVNIDKDKIVKANKAALEIGLPSQENLNILNSPYIFPFTQFKDIKDPFTIDHAYLDKNNITRDIKIRIEPITNGDGEITHIAQYIVDITNYRKIYNELNQLRHTHQLLIDALNAPIYNTDVNGKYIDFNEAFQNLIGKSREEILGKTNEELGLDNDILKHIIDGKSKDVIFERSLFHEQKEEDESGGKIGVIENIANLNHLESKLREQAKKYQMVFENIGIGAGLLFIDKKRIEANPAYCEIFECTENEINDKTLIESFVDQLVRDEYIETLKKEGDIKHLDVKIKTYKGNTKRVIVSAHQFPATNQRFFTVVDNTSSKETEQVQVMVHDLKSPLNGAIQAQEVLLLETTDKDQIELIVSTIGLLRRMVTDIEHTLDIGKMEAGTYKFNKGQICVGTVMAHAIMELEDISRTKNIEIIIPEDMQDKCSISGNAVLGEERLIYKVFENLLKNALEASDCNKNIFIDIANIDYENKKVKLSISNSGVVPVEIRDKLLKHKNITKGKVHGTGLGTYSVGLIMKAHGGKLEYETSDEKGITTFFLTFPFKTKEEIQLIIDSSMENSLR